MDTSTKKSKKAAEDCGSKGTGNEMGQCEASPGTKGKVEREWIDLGKFEVQNGSMIFDVDQIPAHVTSIVWLSRSKCRDFRRRKVLKDVCPQ